ncbi:MAG: M1 family metallopeptidase, partial [Gammaproteobacteria bacterium]|nr:M1 family metallopeptidase [Gammaproteobacteria bacterium]
MTRRFCLFVIVCLGACTAPDLPPEPPEPVVLSEVPAGRLPQVVVPLSYALDLTIVPERDMFSGHVTIALDLRQAVDRFFLHAAGLTVDETLLRLADGAIVEAAFSETSVDGVAEVQLSRPVAAGQAASLEISYRARFGDQLKGLYRVRDSGETYAFTQFEPISARAAFPCFDEPAFKTPFEISLTVAPDHRAISATPERERIPLENGLVRHRFEKTPPLPTYLIAFAVGPLDVVEAPDIAPSPQRSRPLPLRGIAAAGKGESLQHALGTTPELLALLEAYFGIAHPYPKLDIIAVPDFASGAMENVGAITYRESLLLLADDAPVQQRRKHALVHAHELAHMWFGNLVTMPWWDDIWLNEAFATWMAYRTVAEWNPAHRAGLSRLNRLKNAMDEDALNNARQIRQPVLNEDDIENAFDGITYNKGGAVLSMFERYLGAERFRSAIRYHLERFEHGNADVDDFIESLAQVGGERVGEAFRSFLFQPGIPMLDMKLSCDETSAVTISQSRFRPIGSEASAAQGWIVPVCLRYGDDKEQHEICDLTGPGETTIPLEDHNCPAWVLPNAGFAGYFHWVIPAEHYPALIGAEAHLTAVEQMSIADSIDAALAAGRLSVGEAGDLLARLAHSERPQVALAPRTFIQDTRDNLVTRASTLRGLLSYADELYAELPAQEAFNPGHMA